MFCCRKSHGTWTPPQLNGNPATSNRTIKKQPAPLPPTPVPETPVPVHLNDDKPQLNGHQDFGNHHKENVENVHQQVDHHQPIENNQTDQQENNITDTPSTDSNQKTDDEQVSDNVVIHTKRRSGILPRPMTFDENSAIPKYPKSESDFKLIKEALQKNEFLSRILISPQLEEVVEAMYTKEVKAKDIVIQQGDKGAHMYVSAKGKYEISLKDKGVVDIFDDIRVFGELAILYSDKRMATIKALTNGSIWVLDRTVYQQIMIGSNIRKHDELLRFLESVDKLNTIGLEALQKVSKLLKSEFFLPGQEIVRQGDKGDKFYIIRAGTVTITKKNEGVVGVCKPKQYFGELALIEEDVRQATVTADAPGVECLTLERQEFIKHFGPVDIRTIKPTTTVKIKEKPVVEYSDLELADFNIKATLGVGGFGRVELIQHKYKPELVFALKYLKKFDMVEQQQQQHVINEKNIQMSCKSIFIIRLYRTYKSRKYLYFLMEACLGGDLWTLLHKQRNHHFEEKDAMFIAGCVIEAFAYLHEKNIVYRDLKPENVLIDQDGYVKLTDFGFAKELGPQGRTYTFAGTPEYVAPEIILNKGHDKAVDYWAFGIFIFELLTGRTPFRTSDHTKTYDKILNGIENIDFPTNIKPKAKHLISKLCKSEPTERLGCQMNGAADVKNHKWFLGFDWDRLNQKKITSSFKPKLKHNLDTRYFESFKEDKDIPPDETSEFDKDF